MAHGQQTGPANAAHVGRPRALATLQKGPCANGELTSGPHHNSPFSLPFHLAPWISSNSYCEDPGGGARDDATSASIPRSRRATGTRPSFSEGSIAIASSNDDPRMW